MGDYNSFSDCEADFDDASSDSSSGTVVPVNHSRNTPFICESCSELHEPSLSVWIRFGPDKKLRCVCNFDAISELMQRRFVDRDLLSSQRRTELMEEDWELYETLQDLMSEEGH